MISRPATARQVIPLPSASPPISGRSRVPRSEETADYKQWLIPEFEQMVVEGVSRVIDLGGGERVMQEFVRVFPLSSYCEDFGVDLLPVFFLGPDMSVPPAFSADWAVEYSPVWRGGGSPVSSALWGAARQ